MFASCAGLRTSVGTIISDAGAPVGLNYTGLGLTTCYLSA